VQGCGRRRGVLRGRGSSARAATSRSTPPTSWPASTSASRSTALQQCSRATTSARRGRPSSSAWRTGRWCDYRSWHRHRLRQGLRAIPTSTRRRTEANIRGGGAKRAAEASTKFARALMERWRRYSTVPTHFYRVREVIRRLLRQPYGSILVYARILSCTPGLCCKCDFIILPF
jgi:hypothetical protein